MDQQDALSASRDEVGWFYALSDAAMGLHGQSFNDGGSGVWDEARIHRAHMNKRTWDHQHYVRRRAKVAATLASLDFAARNDLESVYRPFGAARTTWQAYCVFTKERRSLLGLALRTSAILVAYGKRKKLEGPIIAPFVDLLRWIEDEIAALEHKKIRPGHALPRGHRLQPALDEALGREERAMAAYDVHRRVRADEERKPNRELLEAARETRRLRERDYFLAKLSDESRRMWLAGEP